MQQRPLFWTLLTKFLLYTAEHLLVFLANDIALGNILSTDCRERHSTSPYVSDDPCWISVALGDDVDFHIDLIVNFEIVLRTISPYVGRMQLAQELFEAT
jgi:hypothetical protein